MQGKLVSVVFGVMVPALILLSGYLPVVAAPKGELKIAVSDLGTEQNIPRMGSGGAAKDYLVLFYDPLAGFNSDGTLSTETGLARKWEMSPDGLTWTFYLRKGVKFHDGVEVTAKDVKFTVEQVLRPDSTSDKASVIRATIKSAEVKDPYTVLVHCKKPSLFLPSLLSASGNQEGLIIPKDYLERVGEQAFMKHPVGSGPYKFHSHSLGSHLKLEAVDKHWRDGVPRYKHVTFRIIPEESTRIAMLKTGEVDITLVSRERVNDIKKEGFNVVSKKAAAIVHLAMCMQYAPTPFSDVRFRKALALAINYDAIIKHIFKGLATPSIQWPGKSMLKMGGDPTVKPYSYDPEEARRLIQEGRYEGHEFFVANFSRPGFPESSRVNEALCGYWEKIGLKPKMFMTDWGAWKQRMQGRKSENSVFVTDGATTSEPADVLAYWGGYMHSKVHQTLVQDPEMDKMLDRAAASLNLAEVERLLGAISRYTTDNYTRVPICEINNDFATGKDIPAWNPGQRRYDNNFGDLIRQR
jgi:peptide/nickel transport system substrate-binding protein